MARRSSRTGSRSYKSERSRSQSVTVKVPESLARSTPKWLYEALPRPRALATRHRRIQLLKPKERLVSKTFRVVRRPSVAARTRQVGAYPSRTSLNRNGQIVQHSRKSTKKHLQREKHVKRNRMERKGRRRLYSDLHLVGYCVKS